MARSFDDFDPMTQRTKPKFPDVASAKLAADKAAKGSNFGYNPADTVAQYGPKFPDTATTPPPVFPGVVPPPSVVTPSVPSWQATPEQTIEGQQKIHQDWVQQHNDGLSAIKQAITGESPSGSTAPTGANGYVPPAYSYTPEVPNPGISSLETFAGRGYTPQYEAYRTNKDAYSSNGTPDPVKKFEDFSPHTQEIKLRRMDRERTARNWG